MRGSKRAHTFIIAGTENEIQVQAKLKLMDGIQGENVVHCNIRSSTVTKDKGAEICGGIQ